MHRGQPAPTKSVTTRSAAPAALHASKYESDLMDAIFRIDGNRAETSPNAAGPWDASMQHGSAPAALVTWAAEAIPTAVPMHIVRVTIDLMRPVPVAPLTIETEVLREGRKIQLCAIRLLAEQCRRGARHRAEGPRRQPAAAVRNRGCCDRRAAAGSGHADGAAIFAHSVRDRACRSAWSAAAF